MSEPADTQDRFDDLTALLWLVAAGDAQAFQRMYEREGGLLYALALRMTGSNQLAIEAVRTALLPVWRNIVRFDPQSGSPRVWLITLVRVRTIELMRRRQRDGLGQELAQREVDLDGDLARLAASPHAEARHLRAAMEVLERDSQMLLMLSYLDGMPPGEVAHRIRLPIGTVKSWTRRSLELLRDAWRAPGNAPA